MGMRRYRERAPNVSHPLSIEIDCTLLGIFPGNEAASVSIREAVLHGV
jgi:hypothetical protein